VITNMVRISVTMTVTMSMTVTVTMSVTVVNDVAMVWFLWFFLVIFLSRHHLTVCTEWRHAFFFFTIGNKRVWNVWNLAWWLVGTTLWFTFDPDTSFALELPLVTPLCWYELTVTLACQLANEKTILLPTFIFGIWFVWLLTGELPFTSTPAVPVTGTGIAFHGAWWRWCIDVNLLLVDNTNDFHMVMADNRCNVFYMGVHMSLRVHVG
jgi:hypothetical protein